MNPCPREYKFGSTECGTTTCTDEEIDRCELFAKSLSLKKDRVSRMNLRRKTYAYLRELEREACEFGSLLKSAGFRGQKSDKRRQG